MSLAERPLTVNQAAEYLQAGRTFVYDKMRTGEIESVKIGRLRRIPLDALERYVAAQRMAA